MWDIRHPRQLLDYRSIEDEDLDDR
jgi:hypothetical protein